MTSFRIESLPFQDGLIEPWSRLDPMYRNWPVVYALDGTSEIYVGESLNVAARLKQHLDSPDKSMLATARVIIDSTYNKSVCLDLESYLIRLFAGEGTRQVLNRNDGITDADYYGRDEYRQTFATIFDQLRDDGLFTRSVDEIQNSDLFKLSPFKALTPDQAGAVEDILEGLFEDLEAGQPSRIVINGDPGTGKTVVAVYLMKLLSDIKASDPSQPHETDSLLAEFFAPGYPELLAGFKVGLVVPQQSLRKSIEKVFRKTPGLDPSMVLTPFQVGESTDRFDLLIVDETHRLNQRANQSSGVRNRQFVTINQRLFGEDDTALTQLDWINAMSNHQIYLLDAAQGVRPADLPRSVLDSMLMQVARERRTYRLATQMRVQGGADYVGYVRAMLSPNPPEPRRFPGYDFRLFNSLPAMQRELSRREQEHGLARLVAGYAWPWRSRSDRTAYDIELDGARFRWNTSDTDWINTPSATEEVGSIHTVQGYDLNYAGVIIGPDLRYDRSEGRLQFVRNSYYDTKGKENNPRLGITYSDEDLLQFVTNIYAVLLTRGIRGTYVYVCDPGLRSFLRPLVGDN